MEEKDRLSHHAAGLEALLSLQAECPDMHLLEPNYSAGPNTHEPGHWILAPSLPQLLMLSYWDFQVWMCTCGGHLRLCPLLPLPDDRWQFPVHELRVHHHFLGLILTLSHCPGLPLEVTSYVVSGCGGGLPCLRVCLNGPH